MEDVRMLVQEEGRAARNLIAFHVPPNTGKNVSRKPPWTPRQLDQPSARMTKRSAVTAKTGPRVRSASAGRDKKTELQARYWAYLFGNLQRAVDDFYETCEADESVKECKEVILVLENYIREFHNLIHWFKVKQGFENTTQKPTSLAWEVRKTSPGKVMASLRRDKINHTNNQNSVKKQLNFFNNGKLTSAEEYPKKDFTLEKGFSNEYGLSFGDLKELLQNSKMVSESSNLNKQNSDTDLEHKSEVRVEERNQENCPCLDQSCQTEELALQDSKGPLKTPSATTVPIHKKPLPTSKSAVGLVGKTSTLTPLSINKNVPAGTSRKTVPVSPTNNIPPRTIPGKNVGAVPFVPSKKVSTTAQAKINTNLNRSTNNLSKISNIPQHCSEKNSNEGLKNSEVLDTNKLVEQGMVGPLDDKISTECKNITKTALKQDSKMIINDCVKDKLATDKIAGTVVKVSEGNLMINDTLAEDNSQLTDKTVASNIFNSEKNEMKNILVGNPVCNGEAGQMKETTTKATKQVKVNMEMQTDLSHLAELAATAKKPKATLLIRQNTAPNLSRKSDKSLTSPNVSLETPEADKSSVSTQPRTSFITLKTEISNSEANDEKTAQEKQIIEKPIDEKTSSYKMEFAPIKNRKLTTLEEPLSTETLVRQKTAPSLTRKSVESLTSPNPALETFKVVKSDVSNQERTPATTLKTQISDTEVINRKTAQEKQIIDKLTNENTLSYKMEFPPLKNSKTLENSLSTVPLVRQKTAPSLTTKSNESLTSSNPSLETLKVVKSNVSCQPITPAASLITQTSNPEINNGKTALEKQIVEKSSNDRTLSDNVEFPPLQKQRSTPESNNEKTSSEKQHVENSKTNALSNKLSVPPLKTQNTAPENSSEKLSKEKSSTNVKPLGDKATSCRLATAPKVPRSSTSVESRLRTTQILEHNRAVTTQVKLANDKQKSDEKNTSAKLTNEKTRNEKPSNTKPVNGVNAPRVFRSSTSIELRPKVSFNRTVTSAPVKSQSVENQVSKTRGLNSIVRNQSLKKAKTLFKSEQNLQKKKSIDKDGWETVTGRSKWKSSQPGSRFHLPSPSTSLPALAIASDTPAKLYKERQNQEIAKRNKSQSTTKQNVKTDLDEDKPAASDRKKISNRVRDVKKTNGEMEESNSSKIAKLMDILSSEDEIMNEEEIRKSKELDEKEKELTKEIEHLKQSQIEVDIETDDAETDGENNMGNDEEDTNYRINALKASYEDVCDQLSWADQMDTLEKITKLMENDTSTEGIPYAERLSIVEQLEQELVARHPGRALELHQKLSSPSRRRHLPDSIQRYRERQEAAEAKRNRLREDKTNKIAKLTKKVEEVRAQQEQLKEDRQKRLNEKMLRAQENRAHHLRSIQNKAHDEEEKLKEIRFINEMKQQHNRHDFITSCQEKEDRLRGIHDERQRKQEEKAAKEAAVEERKKVLEAERQERLERMQEKRRKREERIGREQQEKEKERQELNREKFRGHNQRVQALQATRLANAEELQKKIQQKQEESARRHEENIEHIRQRALESAVLRGTADDEAPRLTPYDTYKLCNVCNVLIVSDVYLISHLRGKAHQGAAKDDTASVIVDAPVDTMDAKLAQDRERQKALRRRCKKIRSRMAQRGEEFLSKLSSDAARKVDSPNKPRLLKCIRNVDKLHASQGVGQWPDNAVTLLERNLAEINRLLDKQNELDQKVFRDLNGFNTLSNVLNLDLDIPKNMDPYLPPKCFLTTCMVYSLACVNNPDNARYLVFSNKISLVLDLLLNRLNTLITDDYRTSNKSSTNPPIDAVAGALMKLFALVLHHSQENVTADVPDMAPRLQDIISYTVSVGVVDKLALYCSGVRDPIDDNPQTAQFLLNAIRLLTTLAQTKCVLVKGDPTQLLATLRVTELVGAVSMLYGMLLHQGAPPSALPELPPHTVAVTQATLQLLKAVAQLDLNMFQSVLGAEGISLQLRHIASHLLRYCAPGSVGSDAWVEDKRELLHQVIEVVGYFAVNHRDNQMMLQSGHMPTVLQQLCNLPFSYFSDPCLSRHLLPTLLACCHGNRENKTILEQEVNYQLLEEFRNSEDARLNPLVQLIK